MQDKQCLQRSPYQIFLGDQKLDSAEGYQHIYGGLKLKRRFKRLQLKRRTKERSLLMPFPVEDNTLSTVSSGFSRNCTGQTVTHSMSETDSCKTSDPQHVSSLELLRTVTPGKVDFTPWPQQFLANCKQTAHSEAHLGGISYQICYRGSLESHSERLLNVAMKASKPLFIVRCYNSDRQRLNLDADIESVLHNPLLIEAAESLFLPIACIGDDNLTLPMTEMLARRSNFISIQEPLKNGPCIRIMTNSISRSRPAGTVSVKRELSVSSVALSMAEALRYLGRPVPTYLQLLSKQNIQRTMIHDRIYSSKRNLYFSLNDFELGEAFFAGFDGVISIKSGRINGIKTIRISYDSTRISFSHLVYEAIHNKMAHRIYYATTDERVAIFTKSSDACVHFQTCKLLNFVEDCDSKHALRKTVLRFVPLSSIQSSLVNKLIFEDHFNEAMHLLSPRQGLILRTILQSNTQSIIPDAVDIHINISWSKLSNLGFFDK